MSAAYDPLFLSCSPAFLHVSAYWDAGETWPTCLELGNGALVCFVRPSVKSQSFSDHYEVQIAEQKEVETRQECWHDLCNALVWRAFPKSKWALTLRYYQALSPKRETWSPSDRRSKEEDLCTILTENALVIACCEERDAQAIRDFRWKELFWNRRVGLEERMELFFWGHALLDKARNPYIGMTGHAVFMKVEPSFFQESSIERSRSVDQFLTETIQGDKIRSVQDLSPFPILGFPGFWDDAEQECFYENRRYFRSGRTNK
jgi:hypothetical protein